MAHVNMVLHTSPSFSLKYTHKCTVHWNYTSVEGLHTKASTCSALYAVYNLLPFWDRDNKDDHHQSNCSQAEHHSKCNLYRICMQDDKHTMLAPKKQLYMSHLHESVSPIDMLYNMKSRYPSQSYQYCPLPACYWLQ